MGGGGGTEKLSLLDPAVWAHIGAEFFVEAGTPALDVPLAAAGREEACAVGDSRFGPPGTLTTLAWRQHTGRGRTTQSRDALSGGAAKSLAYFRMMEESCKSFPPGRTRQGVDDLGRAPTRFRAKT